MNCLKKLVLAGSCCLCMAVTQVAKAVPVGLKTVIKTSAAGMGAGLETCNVFVQYSSPLDNHLSVGFSNITALPQFYQDPFGGNTPPNGGFCIPFPLVCSDSFVTVRLKDSTTICPNGQACAGNISLDGDFLWPAGPLLVGGWFNANPPNGIGAPDPVTLQVLIAQFSYPANGTPAAGTLTVFFNAGDIPFPAAFNCAGGCTSDDQCDDGEPCTDDLCVVGVCQNPNNSDPCDDGVFCNGDDTCGGGSCSIHAGDPCVGGGECADSCSNAGGGSCNDASGTPCGSNANTDCDNPDSCDGNGNCVNNGEANGMACTSDGNPCTSDVCNNRVCTHPNVTDGTACGSSANTDCDNPDSCSGGTCVNNGEADGTACTSDGNGCTDDVCSNRVCTHPNSMAGTPCGSNANTDCDNPDTCNGSGACSPNNEPAGTPCGSPADTDCDNADTCNGSGSCQNNGESNGTACTSDGNDCTNDVCNNRQCTHPTAANGTVCDDGSCGAGESCTCQGGNCVSCTTNAQCDDGIDCTVDVCTPAGCANTPDHTACNDDNVCTNDVCDAASGCEYSDNDGVGCSDGNPCTSGDTCSGGSCSGTPDCDEDADCDVAAGETCDLASGCCTGGVEYALDIREKKCPNKLKCNSNGTIKVYIVGDAANDVNDIDLDSIRICLCGGDEADCISPDKPPRVKDKVGPHFTQCGDCSCAKLKKDYIDDIEIKFKHLCDALDPNLPEGALVNWEVRFDLNDGTDGTAHDCTVIDRPGSGQP